MRIAWFTPFHEQSAIGRIGAAVAHELSRFAEVDIWHPPASKTLTTHLKTIACPAGAAADVKALGQYDLTVYNIGDHLANHLEIYESARVAPGVVVLHDLVMHHFFAGYYFQHQGTPDVYRARMEKYYGAEGAVAAQQAIAGMTPGVWETDRVVEFPFFEDAVIGAHGVITHSEFSCLRVRQVFSGPVRKLFLPFLPPPTSAVVPRESLSLAPEDSLVVTIGHANSNKRIVEVVEALGSHSELFSRIVYAVVGQMEASYRERVLSAARRLGMAERIRLFDGFVPDETLRAYLSHADVCVNLRFPVMEAASASLLDAMQAERATIVNDSGFYAELPDDCVWKISPGQERRDLPAALGSLLRDADTRKRLGRNAAQFARQNFRLDRYATGVLEMEKTVQTARPLLQLADRTAARLQSMGLESDHDFLDRLSAEVNHIFGVEADSSEPRSSRSMRTTFIPSDRTLAQLREASAAVGTMPPSPATLRGSAGAVVVALVRRGLFWLLPQLGRLHALLIEFCVKQESQVAELRLSLASLHNAQNETARRLEELAARLEALEEVHVGLRSARGDSISSPDGEQDPTRHS